MDPYLIVLMCSIFFLLFVAAYVMASIYTLLATIVALGVVFYYLLNARRSLHAKFKHDGKTVSAFSVFIVILPVLIATVSAADGFAIWNSPARVVILWGLTLTFWSTMLFVPLAVHSRFRESNLSEIRSSKLVSVIVPAFNEEKVIGSTIEGLLETQYPKKEIIAVDDGSTDRTLEIISRYKDRIKVLHKENGGKASALNYGLQYATGDIVVIVDADTILGRSSLTEIVKGFSVNRNVAAVAGNIKVRNQTNWLTWCQGLEYVLGVQVIRRAFDFFGSVTMVPGALGAYRKDTLIETGTFQKDTMVEDFDTTLKVLKTGFVISGSTKATSYTECPATLRDFIRQRKRWYRGNTQVMVRHSDALINPRYGYLHRIAYPFILINMIGLPFAGLVTIIASILSILNGDTAFVLSIFALFIVLQYLQCALAVRIDNDNPKLIKYSIFLVVGYKQLIDIILIKSVIDAAFKRKPVWTSANRIGLT